ncbi:MAG TPA: hypothetical protein VJ277_03210 [Gemmatimonadales bacterium]|jgi:hypothetical protein|nr:hypothetical protein [Gemmatimonadales bacterium]
MRFLLELGRLRLAFELGIEPEPEPEELQFGFVSNSSLETEIAVED